MGNIFIPLFRLIHAEYSVLPFLLILETPISCPRRAGCRRARWAKQSRPERRPLESDNVIFNDSIFSSCIAALATFFHFFPFLVKSARARQCQDLRCGDPGNCRVLVVQDEREGVNCNQQSKSARCYVIDDTKTVSLPATGAWRATYTAWQARISTLSLRDCIYCKRNLSFLPSVRRAWLACCVCVSVCVCVIWEKTKRFVT